MLLDVLLGKTIVINIQNMYMYMYMASKEKDFLQTQIDLELSF